MNDKIIKVTCEAADTAPVDELQHFQGNLKTLRKEEAELIRASIVEHGFSFPVFVWKSPKGAKKLIDGHQRAFVLKEMVREGWQMSGGVPVAWIHAASEKEAKKKVMLAAGRYAKIDQEGMYEFIEEAGIDFDELMKTIDLPDFNEKAFKANFYLEGIEQPEFDENIETKNKCPKCGYSW